MKGAQAAKAVAVSAALLAIPEFQPEIAEAKQDLSVIADTLDMGDRAGDVTRTCVTEPMRGAPPPEDCDPTHLEETGRKADELLEELQEKVLYAVIGGTALSLFVLARKDRRRKRHYGPFSR